MNDVLLASLQDGATVSPFLPACFSMLLILDILAEWYVMIEGQNCKHFHMFIDYCTN